MNPSCGAPLKSKLLKVFVPHWPIIKKKILSKQSYTHYQIVDVQGLRDGASWEEAP